MSYINNPNYDYERFDKEDPELTEEAKEANKEIIGFAIIMIIFGVGIILLLLNKYKSHFLKWSLGYLFIAAGIAGVAFEFSERYNTRLKNISSFTSKQK